MDLNTIKEKVVSIAESVSKTVIEELKNHMQNIQLTDDSKVEFQNERNNIIKSYGKIYEIKDGGVYIYVKDKEFPKFNKELYKGQQNGFYINKNDELVYNDKLNDEINSKINKTRNRIVEKQNKVLEEFRKVGEEYRVDELGDDEKYAYITRVSDNKELQDFNISDEIYDKIKENNRNNIETILVWNGKEYYIK